MLSAQVYGKIYDLVQQAPEGDVVEVGTAHGAATIAMTLGRLRHDNDAKTYTIDRLQGGSRTRFGTVEDNRAIIQKNFEHFDIKKNVTLLVGNVDEVADAIPDDITISVLMIDADGAVDRDLERFYNKLTPGGLIIIDDYNPDVHLKRRDGGIFVDQKHKLTYNLVNYYRKFGLFDRETVIKNTFFAFKPFDKADFDFSKTNVIEIYRSLTFSNGRMHWFGVRRIGQALKRYPAMHSALKKAYLQLWRPNVWFG